MTFDASKTDFRNAIVTGSETENLNFKLHQMIDTLHKNKRQKLEIEFVVCPNNSIVDINRLIFRLH